MNFLAHIYLSGDNEYIKIGNFIADSMNGKEYLKYPEEIQKGILLHREIDTFTDAHPVFKQSTKKLHKNYSHYSGIIVDIFYDHFLARNWNTYSNVPLADYVDDFYGILKKHYDVLPEETKRIMTYMIPQNWLLSYADTEGIAEVLAGMNRRTKNRSKMHLATTELQQYNSEFEAEFTTFFNELINFSKHKLQTL